MGQVTLNKWLTLGKWSKTLDKLTKPLNENNNGALWSPESMDRHHVH
jgi:hypothetical protein